MAGAFYLGIGVFLLLILVLGYFTYKNLAKNKQKQTQTRYEKVTRVEELYRSLVDRLSQDMTLHQVSAEELLQSEILISENFRTIRDELVRLKDFASPSNQKQLSVQLRDYQQQLKASRDTASNEVLEQNIELLEQKKERIEAAIDEIRQKEALMDLVFNSLLDVEEDLKFGRPVTRLFPAEVYRRFGLTPPAQQSALPPLLERSDE